MFRWYYLTSAYFLAAKELNFLDRLVYGEWASKSGDKLTQAINLMSILAGVSLCWRYFRRSRGIGTGVWLILILVAFLLLSSLWSLDPQTSIRRSILYLFYAMGVIGVFGNLRVDEFLNLVSVISFTAAVLSIVLLPILYNAMMMPEGDALRGIFSHKNSLGEAMAVGVLTTLHSIRAHPRWQLYRFGMLILIIGITLAARSTTSTLMIIFYCGMSSFISLYRRGGAARAIVIFVFPVLVAPVIAFAALDPSAFLDMLGKDPTLTGRTDLWDYVEHYISERPILGWGLMAFWSPSNPLAEEINHRLGWIVPQAHNGLLELLLEVGVVGTSYFGFLFLRNVVLALRCLRIEKDLAITALMCCGALVIYGTSEAVLLDPSEVLLSVFLITGLACERILRANARQRSLGSRRNLHQNVKQVPTRIL